MATELDDLVQWEAHPQLLDAAAQVALQLYIYNWYPTNEDKNRKEANAVLRLRNRFPGFLHAQYLSLMRYFGDLLLAAKDSVPRHIRPRELVHSKMRFSGCGDVDAEACFRDIDQLAPGFTAEIKQRIVNFSIFYWYLK